MCSSWPPLCPTPASDGSRRRSQQTRYGAGRGVHCRLKDWMQPFPVRYVVCYIVFTPSSLLPCAASVLATAAEIRIVLSHMCATAGGIERRRPQASCSCGQFEVQAAAVHDQTKRVRAVRPACPPPLPPPLFPAHVSTHTMHPRCIGWVAEVVNVVAVPCLAGRVVWCGAGPLAMGRCQGPAPL